MNCEYILQNEIHEKFLKGLLKEDQRAEYESHLKSCESCREAFENEKTLFEGIQLVGRQAMKLEIQKQVEKLKDEQSQTDWTLIFKVAAVFFFLVIMPGTLYFLNTDLFTKKTEMAPFEEIDKMNSIELKETEPVEEISVFEDSEEPVIEKEITGRREAKMEKPVSTARGKGLSRELKAKKSKPEKEMDVQTLDGLLGGVEGTTGEDAMGGAGAMESVSRQVAPSAAGVKPEKRRIRAETVSNEKIEIGKLSKQAPTLSSQKAVSVADQSVNADEISELSLRDDLDSKQVDITVYKLLPSKPIMLQEHYMKSTETGSIQPSALQTFNFSSGYKQIVANIAAPAIDKDGITGDADVKDSFKVIIISKEANLINMDWYPAFNIKTSDREKISITQPDNSNLLINFDTNQIYKVDISKDTTEAVLQK